EAERDREGLHVGVLLQAARRPEIEVGRRHLSVRLARERAAEVRVRRPEEVREVAGQPGAERRRTRRAVEGVDDRLAILVVPEADRGELARDHAARCGDRAWRRRDAGSDNLVEAEVQRQIAAATGQRAWRRAGWARIAVRRRGSL